MAKYTVELRELIESGFDIGLKTYPIWSEEHREELNQKIINHYKYREIGFETPGRFKDELNIKMHEIMPYYIEIWKTTQYEYDHLDTANYTETYTITKNSKGNVKNKETGTSKGDGTVEGTSSSDSITKSKNVDIDTPQSAFDIKETNIDSDIDYASNINLNKNEGKANSKDTSKTTTSSELTNDYESNSNHQETETFEKHLKGDAGLKSVQSVIQEQRDITINVDMMIVEALNDLFMQVW